MTWSIAPCARTLLPDPAAPVVRRAAPAAEAALDAEMDRILMDSFPASDPPQWDSLAAGRPVLRALARTSVDSGAR